MKKNTVIAIIAFILALNAGEAFANLPSPIQPAMLTTAQMHHFPGHYFFNQKGTTLIPESDTPHPGYVKTNYVLFYPNTLNLMGNQQQVGETPASISCIYGLTASVPGCPIATTSALPTGGAGKTIVIVDPYDNPYAETDLNVFSTQFHLPACTASNGCFQLIYASGSQPPFNPNYATEIATDIEWAHTMAPQAKIVLVETQDAVDTSLLQADQAVIQDLSVDGGGIVSNSWGTPEEPRDLSFNTIFQASNVLVFAASGDNGSNPTYPATSPDVISVGGTALVRNGQGYFNDETAWSFNLDSPLFPNFGSSGGPSLYQSRPSYQNSVQKVVGNARGVPDLAFDADILTGVYIFDIASGGWLVEGGTSVSAPSMAGIFASSGATIKSAPQVLSAIYGSYVKQGQQYWHDILIGQNQTHSCLHGYDLVTGLGSPQGYRGFLLTNTKNG